MSKSPSMMPLVVVGGAVALGLATGVIGGGGSKLLDPTKDKGPSAVAGGLASHQASWWRDYVVPNLKRLGVSSCTQLAGRQVADLGDAPTNRKVGDAADLWLIDVLGGDAYNALKDDVASAGDGRALSGAALAAVDAFQVWRNAHRTRTFFAGGPNPSSGADVAAFRIEVARLGRVLDSSHYVTSDRPKGSSSTGVWGWVGDHWWYPLAPVHALTDVGAWAIGEAGGAVGGAVSGAAGNILSGVADMVAGLVRGPLGVVAVVGLGYVVYTRSK